MAANINGVSFPGGENGLKLIVVMVIQLCEHIKILNCTIYGWIVWFVNSISIKLFYSVCVRVWLCQRADLPLQILKYDETFQNPHRLNLKMKNGSETEVHSGGAEAIENHYMSSGSLRIKLDLLHILLQLILLKIANPWVK